jgi:hypothetical protein
LDLNQTAETMESTRPPQFSIDYWEENYKKWDFPIDCSKYYVINEQNTCPDFYLKTNNIKQTSINMIGKIFSLHKGPFPNQPEMYLFDSKNGSDFLNSTWMNFYTTIPGYYFIKTPNNDKDAFGFSILFHLIQKILPGNYFVPYVNYNTLKKLEFVDFSITGKIYL